MISFAIQHQALNHRGDSEALAALKVRSDEHKARLSAAANRTEATTFLLFADAVLQRRWLDTLVEEGEYAAQDFLAEELSRRLAADDRVDCSIP